MRRWLPVVAAGAVLICLVALHAVATEADEYRWWRDPTVQQELSLTAAQVKILEGLFASTQAEQRRLGNALDLLESRTEQAIGPAALDELRWRSAVDELEAMRAKRNASRSLMLFKMYRTLSPEQRRRMREMQTTGERASGRRARSRVNRNDAWP